MFCPNCGAQLPDGSVFCSSCGANIGAQTAQPINAAVAPVAQSAAPVAASAGKVNILGAVLAGLLFFTLLLPFQPKGAMVITKPEGWIMILIVIGACILAALKMDGLFVLVSAAGFIVYFLAAILVTFGVHKSGLGISVEDLESIIEIASKSSSSIVSYYKTPGVGITFGMICTLGMVLSPIINRLFARRK